MCKAAEEEISSSIYTKERHTPENQFSVENAMLPEEKAFLRSEDFQTTSKTWRIIYQIASSRPRRNREVRGEPFYTSW